MAGHRKETHIVLKEKHREALEVLYERYGQKLYSYGIGSWNLSEDDSWDMVYHTLEKVIKKFDAYEFESEKKFGSFVFTIFVNLLRNHYRDRKTREEKLRFLTFNESLFEESKSNPSLSTERNVQKALYNRSVEEHQGNGQEPDSLLSLLEEALDELEDWERILLTQRSIDTPYKDIARFIDKPEKQLKVYYQRAKQKLAQIVQAKVVGIKEKAS